MDDGSVSSGLERLSRKELLALVAAQAQVIEGLEAQVTALTHRVAELERLVSRNSGNSSMPPSTDDLPGKTPAADKPAGGGAVKRKRGKQPGAPGAYLAWREDPDDTVPHFPKGACGCGADLARRRRAGCCALAPAARGAGDVGDVHPT